MACLTMPETNAAPLPLYPYTLTDAQRQLDYLRDQIAEANSHLDTNRVLALENAQWQLQSKVDVFNSCHCPPGITSLLDIPDRPPLHDLTWGDALLIAGVAITLFLATVPPAALISAYITAQIAASSAVTAVAGWLSSGGGNEVVDKGEEVIVNTVEGSGQWFASDGSMVYPPNNGAIPGTEVTIDLQPGQTLGRYGTVGPNSNYLTTPGASPDSVSLPPTTDPSSYTEYRVLKPIPGVTESTVAPWGDSAGMGTQYQLPDSIANLEERGYVRIIKK